MKSGLVELWLQSLDQVGSVIQGGQNRVSLHVEQVLEEGAAGVIIPGDANPSSRGASRGRLQVPQASGQPTQNPNNLALQGQGGEAAAQADNQATQKSAEDPDKLGYVPDVGGPGKKLPRFSPKAVPGPHGEKVYPRGSPPRKAIDYFMMFFSVELLQNIVNFSNQYAEDGKVNALTW